MVQGLEYTFFSFRFFRGDKMPKNGGLLSWIVIIITTQYLSSRREENVRLQWIPHFWRGQYKEHLGLPIVSAARNGFSFLVF